jgi:hypothetical protein
VIKKMVLCAAVIGASAVLASSAVAHANPATPMPVIESSAAQLCGAINGNPTPDGVIDGMNSLENRGLDDIDAALVLITAIHHVCPHHEALMMDVIDPIAAEELTPSRGDGLGFQRAEGGRRLAFGCDCRLGPHTVKIHAAQPKVTVT